MKTPLLLLLTSLSLCGSEFPTPYNSEPGWPSRCLLPRRPRRCACRPALKPPSLPPNRTCRTPSPWPGTLAPLVDCRKLHLRGERQKVDLNLRDRILIFEDTNGDGRFDTRKVFTDDLQMLTSIELGYGGVG